jgi:N-alpha-acetyltransferase 40
MGLSDGTKRRSPNAESPPSKRARLTRSSSAENVHSASCAAQTTENPKGDQLVKQLNQYSPTAFREKFISSIPASLEYTPSTKLSNGADPSQRFNLQPTRVEELSDSELNACFDLIEKTSSTDYAAASAGWNPEFKKEEMQTEYMWYILVRQPKPDGSHQDHLTGFLSFLIDMEEGAPIVYIYEVHLVSEARGSGLGSHLMKVVHEIVSKVGMEKSMLTCFTRNEKAESLYRRLGYSEDEISPPPVEKKLRRGKTVVQRPEYIILSRPADVTSEADR